MSIIKKSSFNYQWIINKSKQEGYDPTLIEKVIYAFELLGNIAESDIDFIFKGGTSILLLLSDSIPRLSIDIDIILLNNEIDLTSTFDEIVKRSIFIKWKEDKREHTNQIQLKHYKFYYFSAINKREEPVLLDILFSNVSHYAVMKNKSIDLSLFEIEKNITVKIPSIDCLFADKLTAFAPNTIGVPYNRGKSTEIIKQLFDLGKLFDHIINLETIKNTYHKIAFTESAIRGRKESISYFLDDSLETSFYISQMGFKNSINNEKITELKSGIKRFKGFVKKGKYSLIDVKVDASKVAVIASLLRNGTNMEIKDIQKGNIELDIKREKLISNKFRILNKLKNISTEAFYLWCLVEKYSRSNKWI